MTTQTTPNYEASTDLSNVSEGDRVTFTTRTDRTNGVPIRSTKTVTVDDVTVETRDGLESYEVEDGIDYREVEETHVEVVAIDGGYRYTFKQTDDGTVRVSSCKQSDWVDQHERGEFNAVARSNVSHGYITSWSHKRVATDGGVVVDTDDEDDTTTRRTRKDLRYLASDDRDDAKRNTRLIGHGWLTSKGRLSAKGDRLSRVIEVMDNRDALDITLDLVGMDVFVDSCVKADDPIAYFAGLRTAANLLDEARHQADTQDVEYDHDGLFKGHFADFNPRKGTVDLRFRSKATAIEFEHRWSPDRWDVERSHDERFTSNRNPKRLTVTVV